MAGLMEDDLLSSDSEDDDYVPSGAEGESEEDQSGEEEDLSLLAKDGEADTVNAGKGKRLKKKKKKNTEAPCKRAGGIKLEEEAPTNGVPKEKDDYNKLLAKQIQQEKEEKKKDEEKSKADSLWSDFMKDVGGPKPKPKVSTGLGSLASLTKPSPKPSTTSSSPSSSSSSSSTSTPTQKPAEKITITKEYDFAGETVKITKEVSADSKEAKEEQQKHEEKEKPVTKPTDGPKLSALGIGGAGMKRPGGLGSVLGKLGKKPKISTLDKSKLDWERFKSAEGISEELATHNKGKDGYIERQQFLQRTDLRQFEQEKDLRAKNRKSFLS